MQKSIRVSPQKRSEWSERTEQPSHKGNGQVNDSDMLALINLTGMLTREPSADTYARFSGAIFISTLSSKVMGR